MTSYYLNQWYPISQTHAYVRHQNYMSEQILSVLQFDEVLICGKRLIDFIYLINKLHK